VSSIDIFLDPVLPTDPVIIGRVTSVHGIKGWVKIHSYTEEPKKIFDYEPWWINAGEG
jgi:16S rRNA processing protein RimM